MRISDWSSDVCSSDLSTQRASAVTTGATMKMTNTAGPSPLSAAARFRPQTVQTGLTVRKPSKSGPVPHRGQRHRGPAAKGETGGCRSVIRSWGGAASTTPPVDADEQEQPHHVDEMPVPGGRLEPEMMVGLERSEEHTSELQ